MSYDEKGEWIPEFKVGQKITIAEGTVVEIMGISSERRYTCRIIRPCQLMTEEFLRDMMMDPGGCAVRIRVARMCGGQDRRGAWLRRVPGGVVCDRLGVGMWWRWTT